MKYLLVILINVSVFSLWAQRSMQNINENWMYLEQPFTNPEQLSDQQSWEKIDLPHSWNSVDATDMQPGYRRNASWYKKSITIDKSEESRFILAFEGANLVTDVYVNQEHVGQHVGGYLYFDFEITEQLKYGENELLVRVDNSYNVDIIPSQKSDFFIFGGITRDVWLKEVATTYIRDIDINTPEVSAKEGVAEVRVEVDGPVKGLDYEILLLGPDGETVAETSGRFKSAVVEETIKIANPELWDMDEPNLYTVEVRLKKGKTTIDSNNSTLGFRWYEFKDYGGFYLNGKRVLLRGTHRHEEHAGYGAAMPNALHRKDMELIKSMGANFVRLGHYPQDPEVYKACNELGLLVWDELPWCRGGVGGDVWKDNTRKMLKQIIDQNRNHPSIILWSLGNEIYWLPDFEGGDDRAKINEFLTELNDMAHDLDPYRKTSIRKYYEGADIVDVFSPSIWSGWYSGNYKNYEKAIDKYFKKYPHFIHMEYGGSSHVGRHTENPITGDGFVNPDEWEEAINQVEVANVAQRGDWSENYIVDLFDWHLSVSETYEDYVGNAQWAFKDFGTPLRPENDIPYINQKGVTDRAGNPKDAYYVFKSYWSDDPFAYIESHTWTERSGPTGVLRNMSIYSNAEEVEFFHNGTSKGKKSRDIQQFPACGLNWDIEFTEGKNELIAVAYMEGKQVATDTLEINYTYTRSGAPQRLVLNYEEQPNGNLLVIAEAQDESGLRCLDYEERVYFQCLAGGELVNNMGTPNGTSAIKMANGQAAIEVIPSGSEPVEMTVLNQSFKGTFLTIPN